MNRITISSLLLAMLCLSACREPYEHRRLDEQSQPFRQIVQLTQALRDTPDGQMDELVRFHAGPNATDEDRQALAAALGRLRKAEEVRLLFVDRFGPKIYRATFELHTGEATGRVAMLLVCPDENTLYWARPN